MVTVPGSPTLTESIEGTVAVASAAPPAAGVAAAGVAAAGVADDEPQAVRIEMTSNSTTKFGLADIAISFQPGRLCLALELPTTKV
jgi:hypothetical protein